MCVCLCICVSVLHVCERKRIYPTNTLRLLHTLVAVLNITVMVIRIHPSFHISRVHSQHGQVCGWRSRVKSLTSDLSIYHSLLLSKLGAPFPDLVKGDTHEILTDITGIPPAYARGHITSSLNSLWKRECYCRAT